QREREAKYRSLAKSCAPLKALSAAVRNEMILLIKRMEPRIKRYYQALYGDDRLLLDTVTTGHAANPDVKNELNVNFRAGTERIRAAPYANAGRMRAIAISFVFAVLEESENTLSVLLLDDPAISLDDEHKARLLDHLVSPTLAGRQVILSTHYEKFFKQAEFV